MRFRDKLLGIGILFVALPAAAIVALYTSLMASSVESSAEALVETKLGLLDNRVSSAYDILYRAGLAENDFYLRTMRSSIADYFDSLMAEGESFYILGPSGAVLEASSAAEGLLLAPDDPLRALLGREPGRFSGTSPAFPEGSTPHFAAFRSFEPLGWTLVVASDERSYQAPLRHAIFFSVAVSGVLLVLAILLLFYLSRRTTEPLARLTRLAQAVGEGRLDLRAAIRGKDEIALLAGEFDEMARKLEALTSGLEQRVAERTAELSAANGRLSAVNRELESSLERVASMQSQLVQAEKLAALGQLVAGIAHELNSPLAASSSAAEALRASLAALPSILDYLAALEPGRRAAFFELLASLSPSGILEAGGADRRGRAAALRLAGAERGLDDPGELADCLLDAGYLEDFLPPLLTRQGGEKMAKILYEISTLSRSAAIVDTASAQATRVIAALRIYARQDGRGERLPVDLAGSIDAVLTLFASRIKLGVDLERSYGALPTVLASAEKLAQVWTNLLANALQAMEYRGCLRIRISEREGQALVEIEDSGSGIQPENFDKVFQPFFTTKPPGEGTGLGLEISRRIVEELGGGIDFESEPGRTIFRVRLPLLDALH